MASGLKREMKQLMAWAQEQGWCVTLSSSNHYKLTHPSVKGAVFTSYTPSDGRSVLNARSMIKRKMMVG
jgi:hypothetical protein